MSDAPEELFLEGESDATHGSNGWLGCERLSHAWLDGAALGLRSRDDAGVGAVYPFPEEDCYGSHSCLGVMQACALRPDEHLRAGSIDVLPDAQ